MNPLDPLPTRETLDEALRDYSQWPQVDPLSLEEENRNPFGMKRRAIIRYLQGASHHEIETQTKISRGEVLRLFRRCLEPHPQGGIWGFRALLPYVRIKSYERTKAPCPTGNPANPGLAGAFMQLLTQYPDLRDLIDRLYLKKPVKNQGVPEARISLKEIHKKFLNYCRKLQIPDSSYPFTSESQGKHSLSSYLKRLSQNLPVQSAAARDSPKIANKLGSGEDSNLTRPEEPYQMVEFDGHKIDASWTINVPHPHLVSVPVVLSRIWILLIIECFSRAILGYSLCFRTEYSQYHVLNCIKNSLIPWKPMTLSIPGLNYHPGSGLPSGVIPEFAWAKWDLLLYDNAMANLANRIRKILKECIQSDINAGPIYTLDHRSLVEGFFKILEENLYHRLPNTTGSHAQDGRRNHPEEAARKYNINIEDLKQITDVYLAGYNSTPNQGLGYATPLEALQNYSAKDSLFIKTIPSEERSSLWLLNESKLCPIKGNLKTGLRPYINFYYARYDNHVLRNSPGLIGKEIRVYFDASADIRYLRGFVDGKDIGILEVKGGWALSAHDLLTRQTIARMKLRKYLHYQEHEDPVQVFLDHLETRAIHSKRARNLLADTRFSQAELTKSAPGLPPPQPLAQPYSTDSNSQADEFSTQDLAGKVYLLRRR